MTREEFFAAKNKGALWDVGVSINRTNPLPLDKNAVFDTYENALTYAKGVLAYPGQFIAVVGEDAVTGYLITVAGGEGATLVKLAQTSDSGDVNEQLNALSTKVNNIVNEIGKASTDGSDATGLYKLIEANKNAITVLIIGLPEEVDDHVCNGIREETDRYISAGKVQKLIFDFSKTGFMDSSGIGILLGRYKRMHHMGGEVLVTGEDAKIRRLLRISGVYQVVGTL